ncbi:phosphatidylinositol-specific phospholipase C/glycerophosphodiester phosphodiesterase family protein [Mucilaginibacter sp.]|uniref:phosphatidylinositol-specific phospholipase C/glycerophosphodiester phosphodiesterase family protein n=1 Tax=Mucilaginibacter sp. TaxID=1882438 RepID=UPI002850044E|nr:phosphatidylinositol-specific phospholipase C/glycerophosphodiester phosphodiesterase family protein [Mucilaginibacter sp.]MDR3695253.1 phosphatidylinositol-specific phospholipase C/glycerophosphodiester phosphodiesterase family protein [Mucilaginibacter sp.]
MVVLLLFTLQSVQAQFIPLINGFAHNDYRHRHPLFDALDNGYTNIEADVFLRRGKLIVAHIDPYFKRHRTLEALYLKPLADRIAGNKGQVYSGFNTPVILMIDIKTGSDSTYSALMVLLEKYKNILSVYDHGSLHQGAVTVVLSGHKPYQMIQSEQNRYAFIDEDLRRASLDTLGAKVYQMASCKYSKLLKWDGKGKMPDDEQKKLCSYVAIAHKYGEKVRLWASPENKEVWTELLKCGVDLINTDKLVTLKNFLNDHKSIIASNETVITPNKGASVLDF